MSKPRFFRRRIYLDETFSRRTTDHQKHWVGSSFKAFAVIGSNNSSFSLSLVPDPFDAAVEGIPLQEGGWHNFSVMPNNACFENATAQPGLYVDVLISTEDPLTSGKIQAIVTSKSIQWEGSTSPQSKITVTSTASQILDADGTRIVGRFQWKSGTDTVYVGSLAELADADYQNICFQINPGDDFEFFGTGALYAKTAAGTVIYARMRGIQ